MNSDVMNNWKSVWESALEDFCNAYDEACMKYIDNKIDKGRFKKAYERELRNLVESPKTKERYATSQTRFHATLKVYNEWYNLEN